MNLECSRCRLIRAIRKLSLNLKITADKKIQLSINDFLKGLKTFRETALLMGATEAQMESVLERKFWDQRLQDED